MANINIPFLHLEVSESDALGFIEIYCNNGSKVSLTFDSIKVTKANISVFDDELGLFAIGTHEVDKIEISFDGV